MQLPPILWASKIHKTWHPLRPFVPSGGSIIHWVAKELANIITSLVCQSPHHIKNTQQFVDYIHQVKLEPGEAITSYDIKALFTSVPVNLVIPIVQQKLQQESLLSQRTNMSIPNTVKLLGFCHKNMYFLLQGKYYKQVHGAAMGSPICPLNLFMKEFEVKAINSASTPHAYGSGL